ncbi:MAG: lipoprotein [Pseudomonadota bacterium]
MAKLIRYKKIAVCLSVGVALAGCGVRGSLEYPDQTQPAQSASAESGQGKEKGAASKPHKGFILDGLIQ